MSTATSLELTCPPRFGTSRDVERETLGPKVAEVARRLGAELMPWQQHVLDVAYELDPATGQLVYREVNVTIPRQSGKTTLGLAVLTHRCTRWGGRQNVTYTAQSRNAAAKKWGDEHVPELERSPYRGRFTVRRTNGSEAVLWSNGSRWAIDAPSKTAGHGDTLDLGFIDEAFAHEDDRVEQAMAPAMLTRASPQVWVASTAGTGQSFYLWRKILAGRVACRSGEHGRTAYFEWSAPDEAPIGDPDTWVACQPALGYTVTMDALHAQYERAKRTGPPGLAMFERAYLNRWPEVPVLAELEAEAGALPAVAWAERLDPSQGRGDRVVFALDVSRDRSFASIGAAGPRRDGTAYVELVEHRAGTGWVVDRAVELVDRWGGVFVVDSVGPAASMAERLTTAGVPVHRVTTTQVAEACGAFYDAVVEGTVAHFGEPALEDAVAAAQQRPLGDRFAWARKSRKSTVDISPLVAVTLAHWGITGIELDEPVPVVEHVSVPYSGLDDYLGDDES